MSQKPISPLRARMLEDKTVRNFVEKTKNDCIRCVKSFAAFLGRSDQATPEELCAFQVHQTETGVRPPTRPRTRDAQANGPLLTWRRWHCRGAGKYGRPPPCANLAGGESVTGISTGAAMIIPALTGKALGHDPFPLRNHSFLPDDDIAGGRQRWRC